MTTHATILIVDSDSTARDALAAKARARGYIVLVASALSELRPALDDGPVHVAIVNLALGSESGLDAIRVVRDHGADAEFIVISGSTSVASAIESYELNACAFIQQPFDSDHLFAAVERARERRQMNLANRRLVWELQLINEIGADLRRSLDP